MYIIIDIREMVRSSRRYGHIFVDLDNTLICTLARRHRLMAPHLEFVMNGERYCVYLRPGCHEFLRGLGTLGRVHLWTAATKPYAVRILNGLGLGRYFSTVRTRRHTDSSYRKRLPRDSILLDDQSAHHGAVNRAGTVVRVPGYDLPSYTDRKLRRVLSFLRRRRLMSA